MPTWTLCCASIRPAGSPARSRPESRKACSRCCRAPISSYRMEPEAPPAWRQDGRRLMRCPISSSRRGSRSSSGAKGPTRSCSGSRRTGGLAIRKSTRRKSSGMFADPRSKSLVTNFAFQWLSVRQPRLDRSRPAALSELRRGLEAGVRRRDGAVPRQHPARRQASVVEVLTAPYTFVNERLALHYDIGGVRGERFRRVELTDPHRLGVFGKGSC